MKNRYTKKNLLFISAILFCNITITMHRQTKTHNNMASSTKNDFRKHIAASEQLNRQKNSAQTRRDLLQANYSAWQTITDLHKKLDRLKKDSHTIRTKNKRLKIENADLKAQIADLSDPYQDILNALFPPRQRPTVNAATFFRSIEATNTPSWLARI